MFCYACVGGNHCDKKEKKLKDCYCVCHNQNLHFACLRSVSKCWLAPIKNSKESFRDWASSQNFSARTISCVINCWIVNALRFADLVIPSRGYILYFLEIKSCILKTLSLILRYFVRPSEGTSWTTYQQRVSLFYLRGQILTHGIKKKFNSVYRHFYS